MYICTDKSMLIMKIKFSCYYIILLTILTGFCSCSRQNKTYVIGVSQCSSGHWREKVNHEMLAAQHLYERNAKVIIANSFDDTNLQIRQIDSLANEGVDLLVVAPNEAAPVADAISRVRAKGIPVVYFDRKAENDDYTAFIGGNNTGAGLVTGNYAVSVAKSMMVGSRKPLVMEVTASMASSPARERHEGFQQAMKGQEDLEYICKEGDWTSDAAYRLVKEQISSGRVPDIVFCHNDGMATGAYKAAVETDNAEKIKIIGIDGMPGEGLEYVKLGHQIATYVYPTHGEEIVRLALNILTGQPYDRDNELTGMLVIPENVDAIAATSGELLKQNQDLVTIQDKLEEYFGISNIQSKVIAAAVFAILLLIGALLLMWQAVRKMRTANQRVRQANEEQTAFYTNARHQLRTPLTLIAGPVRQILDSDALKGEQREMMEVISRNVGQLETCVNDVLDFKMQPERNKVDDDDADLHTDQPVPDDILQEGRLAQLKFDDSDELATVLIVDDNDDMRRYLKTLLCDKFYVLEAADGHIGMKLARECVPDIVVSDVMMPVMDGLQFCKQLKEDSITSHIPVILLTARSTEEQQMEGYEHGADAYITKPFNACLLVVRIYNLLKNRQTLKLADDGKKEEKQPKIATQDKLFADALKDTFQKHMSNPELKMDELGDELGMSRVQLYRKVKALTGLSPVELLREMRLQKAYTLINTTTKSISQIAYDVGFNTPSYFSNCFKKQFGLYPTDLRAEP